jgi:7-cyano-7-deazaguanine reductase
MTSNASDVKYLGKDTPIVDNPDLFEIDRVPNPHPDLYYCARFTAPEMTSLCPATGQPDFGTMVIDYVPNRWLIESKALKLFIFSFRNHRAFHEDCTLTIGKRLADAVKPHWLRIGGFWHARGGIPIDIVWQTGPLPTYVDSVPALNMREFQAAR